MDGRFTRVCLRPRHLCVDNGRLLLFQARSNDISVPTPPRKKTATACAFAKQGRGLIKVNGQPIENIEPECLRLKAFEPVLILGQDKFANLDVSVALSCHASIIFWPCPNINPCLSRFASG